MFRSRGLEFRSRDADPHFPYSRDLIGVAICDVIPMSNEMLRVLISRRHITSGRASSQTHTPTHTGSLAASTRNIKPVHHDDAQPNGATQQ
jgi:hypothetical protein